MFCFGKKDEKKGCCCGNVTQESVANAEQFKIVKGIKVLGGGCSKCHELQANTESALKELGQNIPVELITDFSVIAAYGVMSTPALVVNEQVVAYGKVLKKDDVLAILKDKL